MKKILYLFLILPLLCSCMTGNQLKAEQSYYEAMVAMQKQQGVNPLVQIIPQDKDKPIIMQNVASFTVFAPPAPQYGPLLPQYQQKDYVQPWLNLIGTAVPWFGAWGIAKATGDAISSIPHVNSTTLNAGGNAMTGGTMTTTATSTTTNLTNTVSGTGNVANIGGTVNQSTAPPSYPPK